MKSLSKVFPSVFILLVALVALGVLWRLSAVPSAPEPPNAEKQALVSYNQCLSIATALGPLDAKALQACGQQLAKSSASDDYLKARMDEMRWMLTLIGSLAAFFAIAQGASAYFSAQSYTKSADEAIARIEKLETDLRVKYPLFATVEKARRDAYDDLRSALKFVSKADDPAADPLEALVFTDKFYARLPVSSRQRLLSVESFASIDLDTEHLGNEEYASDLVRLGVFYHSKFLYEATWSRSCVADAERAEVYFLLAFAQSERDFTILNELGHLFINCHKQLGSTLVPYLAKAKEQFNQSALLQPKQQRAYYNLALIEGAHSQRYDEAAKCLREKALQHDNWQRMPVRYTKSFVCYNLGCYLARDLALKLPATAAITEPDIADCLAALDDAAALHCIPKNTVLGRIHI